MLAPIVATKLFIPPPRAKDVFRHDLIQVMGGGQDRKLTLISAPAGYGKTTLASAWIAQSQIKVAWYSIDVADNDPVRFWDYAIAAIRTAFPGTGEQTLTLLHEPQPLPIETILSTLINELSALPDSVALVLDDYHVIQSSDVHDGLAFLVEHMPSQLRLVMTTRIDPPLPLSRMRVRGDLLEIRSADLRFPPPQIAHFFTNVMGLTLSAEDIAALDTRVEGWIAGLQLAGLALQGKSNPAEFIASFAGDHHYVLDYLGDELLDQMPDAMQQFLLQTSVLERMNAELCNTILNVADSRAVLDHLERNHFFVVALDDKRQWYRYHRLFGDFLRHRLGLKYPDRVNELHQRASQWFEQNGLLSEAIDHALAARDHSRAAALIQGIAELLIWQRAEHNTLLGWLKALPDSVLQKYPRLCLYHAWVLYLTNQMSAAEQRIRDAETALSLTPGNQDPTTAGMLAAIHSTLTAVRHRFPATLTLARQALELLPEEAVSWRCMAAINLGVTCAYIGDVQEATDVLSYAMELSQEVGSAFAMVSAFWHLSSLQLSQLTLRAAEKTCQQLENAARLPGLQRFPTAGYMVLLLGEIHIERNELVAAEKYLQESAEQINPESFPMALLRAYVGLSRLKTLQGDLVGAGEFWELAEQLERMSKLQGRSTQLSIARARRLLEQGDYSALDKWAAENQLGADDAIGYDREGYYLMLARLYSAVGTKIDSALHLLERLVKQAEGSRRAGSMIRALVLQAVAYDIANDRQSAVESLVRALVLAEPDQPVRVFVDEGPSVARLLEAVIDLQRNGRLQPSVSTDYISRLLAATAKRSQPPAVSRRPVGHVHDALSLREVEVLRLLADGLDSNEVAERLVIAVDTARKHIKNIYSKLGVHSRWEALKHAETHRLL
ncbi:MAG: hypothetical protein IPM16_02090 [Chloroflexi bacterium]|nr:hypothetical protein [Chloroflexota bacterium]